MRAPRALRARQPKQHIGPFGGRGSPWPWPI
nr:MAG TPA: hypothetical protein [Caudoviricetes sp.]